MTRDGEVLAATLGDATRLAADRLRGAGIAAARREARLVVALAAGTSPETVLGWPERPLSPAGALVLAGLLDRRCRGEPLSRIRGSREFWSMEFQLGPDTLDPRPDTETLVEAVLARVRERARAYRILDLGTGTGCVLLALLRELPESFGVGLDVAPGAAATASLNARLLGYAERAHFAVSDWAEAVRGEFDIVVSNPPYIPAEEMPRLDSAVRDFDPHRALAGGADGYDAYRRIVRDLERLLRPDGLAAFEVGEGQSDEVAGMLAHAGLDAVEIVPDLAGIGRCVVGHAPQNGAVRAKRGLHDGA